MCGVSLKNRVSNEELNRRLAVEQVADVVRQGRLRWFGHLERKDSDDWVSSCRNIEVGVQRAGVEARRRGESVSDMIWTCLV